MGFFDKSKSRMMQSVDDDKEYHTLKEIMKEIPSLEKLISKRNTIMDKIDEYPNSEFYELRKKELSPILKQIEDHKKNIKKNISKISKEQYLNLPFELQEKVNLLNFETE